MAKAKRGFSMPNYTQTPNNLFDELLPELGLAELKVVLVVIRYTFGYHRRKTSLSVRKIAELTGLAPKNVRAGAKQLEKRGLIKRMKDGLKTTTWRAVVRMGTQSTQERVRKVPSNGDSVYPQSRLERKKENPKESAGGILEVPEHLRVYYQVCVNKPIALPEPTTIKEIRSWVETFEEWSGKGFTLEQIEAAARKARRKEKIIAYPKSLNWLLNDGHSRTNGHEGQSTNDSDSVLAKLAQRSA